MNTSERGSFSIIIGCLFLALGLIVSTVIMAWTWKEKQAASQVLKVTGSAIKPFRADLGILRGTLAASGATGTAAFNELERQKPLFLAFMKERGITSDQIGFAPQTRSTFQEYDKNGQATGNVLKHEIYQRFAYESPDVHRIQQLSLELAGLLAQGVYISVDQPTYLFTDLSNVKVEIQALAARDALERAAEIARSTGSSLGALRSARMGVLQIRPRNSTMVEDYGVNDTSSIEKEIKAVVHASFSISQPRTLGELR